MTARMIVFDPTLCSRAVRFAALLAGVSTSGAACARRSRPEGTDARETTATDARSAETTADTPGETVTPLALEEPPTLDPVDAEGRPRSRALGYGSRPCPDREPREGARCESPARCAYGVRSAFVCASSARPRWRRSPVVLERNLRDRCPSESPLAGQPCDRMAVCRYVSDGFAMSSVVCTRASDREPWRWRWAWDPLALQCAGPDESARDATGGGWRCDASDGGFRWQSHGVVLIEGPLPPPSLSP